MRIGELAKKADLNPRTIRYYEGIGVLPTAPRTAAGYRHMHTEASDRQVAGMLTRMMGPKVFTVPSLAKIPRDLLANVYVFTNGVRGDGPFGFQVDVFDAVPGEARYTPLRAVTLVSWRDGATARVLGSVAEIQAAAQKGEVALARPGVGSEHADPDVARGAAVDRPPIPIVSCTVSRAQEANYLTKEQLRCCRHRHVALTRHDGNLMVGKDRGQPFGGPLEECGAVLSE